MACVIRAELIEDQHEAIVFTVENDYRITQGDFRRLAPVVGEEVDEDALQTADTRLKCIKKAFSCLAYGDLSAKKLTQKLKERFEPDMASEVVRLFIKKGYLDDTRLAARYALNFAEVKKWGPSRIRASLRERGFHDEDIEQALQAVPQDTYHDALLRLIKDRAPDCSYRNIYAKTMAYLYRMGFGYDEARHALNEYRQDTE